MLQTKVFGLGAAGNKAAIKLIEMGVLPRESVMLLNTTRKDVPSKYNDEDFVEFGDIRGCGKERELAKNLMVQALQDDKIPIDEFLTGDEKFLILVSSTEGGTGSGASIVLAEYLQDITNIPIHLVSLIGFEDDIRGMKNSIDWFNDLNNKFIIQSISNKKCLEHTNGNRKKAENYANEIFAKRVAIMCGKHINPSENNIDDTDLFKLNACPGFMTVEMANLEKIKDSKQFNEFIKNILEESVSLDTEPSAKRLGVIVNASEKTIDAIDTSYEAIKAKYGIPTEIFNHSQIADDINDTVAIIAVGMKYPIDEIKDVYTRFKRLSEKLDTKKDAFFSSQGMFNTNLDSGMDIGTFARTPKPSENKKVMGKSSFFSKYGFNEKKDIIINKANNDIANEL